MLSYPTEKVYTMRGGVCQTGILKAEQNPQAVKETRELAANG